MQTSIEKISNIERKITISIPVDQIESTYTKKLNEFAKKANIKGFRPGKAPLSYISQRFGQEIRFEVINEVMQNSIYEALKEHKLTPVSTPQVAPKEMGEGKPLEFEVTFEVIPEIEKVNFSMDEIEKLKVDITDKDIDYVLKHLAKQNAKWTDVDREAKKGDRVVLDYEMLIDGKSEQKDENFNFEIGQKKLLPGFEEAIINSKAQEEKKFTLQFPEDFADKEKAGKSADFIVKIKKVVEAEIPEIDSKFVKDMAIASGEVDDLKKQVRESLEQERDRILKDKIKDQVFEHLYAGNPIEVPKALIEREAKRIHDELYPQHRGQEAHHHSKDETESFNEIAKKRVAIGILIGEYVKENKLVADQELVKKRIKEIASLYHTPKDAEAWLSVGEALKNVESQVLEDQLIEKLTENVKSNEKIMSYGELKGFETDEDR